MLLHLKQNDVISNVRIEDCEEEGEMSVEQGLREPAIIMRISLSAKLDLHILEEATLLNVRRYN